MRDLERTLRTAVPTISRVPAELEDRIWAVLDDAPTVAAATDEPLLTVDVAPPRRPSRLRLAIGVAAVAAVLLGAIVIAGLRNGSTARPGRPPAPPTVTTPDPRTELGS